METAILIFLRVEDIFCKKFLEYVLFNHKNDTGYDDYYKWEKASWIEQLVVACVTLGQQCLWPPCGEVHDSNLDGTVNVLSMIFAGFLSPTGQMLGYDF